MRPYERANNRLAMMSRSAGYKKWSAIFASACPARERLPSVSLYADYRHLFNEERGVEQERQCKPDPYNGSFERILTRLYQS